MNPKVMRQKALRIAGVSGDGNETAKIWQEYEQLAALKPLTNKVSESSYEIRIIEGESCIVQVGQLVGDGTLPEGYELFTLPASHYASFEVYIARGYMSENNAMMEWLQSNESEYRQGLLNGKEYIVEYYDERFNGGEAGSIVEMWLPVKKV